MWNSGKLILRISEMITSQKHWTRKLPAEHNYTWLGSFVTLKCLILLRKYINCSNDITTHHNLVGNKSAYEEFWIIVQASLWIWHCNLEIYSKEVTAVHICKSSYFFVLWNWKSVIKSFVSVVRPSSVHPYKKY